MRFVRLLLVISLLFGAVAAAADTTPPYEAFPSALGVAFGPISGTGLHYHRWNGPTGFQVAAGILYLPPGEVGWMSNMLDYNVGGAFQRRVYGDRFADWLAGSLYLFAGGNHRGYIPVIGPVSVPEGEAVDYRVGSYQAELGLGAGIGFEIILFRHFSIPADFGYGASWTMTEPDLSNAFRVQLYGQTALRYRY